MNKSLCSGLMALTLLGTLMAPITVSAQDNRDRHDYQDNRDRDRDRHDDRDRDHGYYHAWDDNQRRDWLDHHRNETKNEWRNIAIGAGAVGVLGLLNHDDTLAVLGGAGALYSLDRYNHDRRSEDREDRLRAAYFNHNHFYRDGVRYDRHLVKRNGQRYYQFERH